VLALFCGEEPARFARARTLADGDPLELEPLAENLPPGYADKVALASQAMTLGTAYALSWPLPEAVRVTSPFGQREHPILGGRRMHNGIDLGAPSGTGVRAVASGIVRRASSDATNGRIVIVDHGRGVSTLYCHNDELLVRAGDRVARGQLLSRSGSTGRSTGPHLHYQLELAGQPVDPLRYRAGKVHMSGGGASD
jgi:murein DD-endopeptidase MepM/ murein hydrolase activator NlpD